MYYRDLAKYFYIKNNLNFSKYYFKKALEIFSYNNFDGQKKMILLDNEQYSYNINESNIKEVEVL